MTLPPGSGQIVLASKSASRRTMLGAAGVAFEVRPAAIDERALEARLSDAGPGTVALALGGRIEWSHVARAALQVRELSDAFIEAYLAAEWPEVSQCVGVFRIEALGPQLFESIEGDMFTVLGMPLLPVLGALRELGKLPA